MAAEDLCCVNCFDDEYLQRYIEENGEQGDCAYCGSEAIQCIWPGDLTELFEPLVRQYKIVEIGVNRTPDEDPDAVGDRLADRIDYEWCVFSELVGEEKHNLLSEIVNAHSDPKEGVVDVEDLWTERSESFLERSLVDEWNSFAHHLRHVRRYIPNPRLDLERPRDPREYLADALQRVEGVIQAGTEVFRARAGFSNPGWRKEPRPPEAMGAPPKQITTQGRMNPSGIPYLYVALSEYSAAAEIRPWKGALITVARFALAKDYRVADLTDAPTIPTPFGRENFAVEVEEHELLTFLGRELGRPIDPDTVSIDYVPTQYLTEMIQEFGFEAIKYPSALGREANLVIFDHSQLRPDSTWLCEVDDITYKLKKPRRRELLSDL